ncbi:MAG: iron-containing alcohol dehydrogenase [Defluviitaleaceae bacterium]|nr:iron-containing alcohol dehydrogenase [Defluviitaleaceae bacterium]
MNNFIHHRPTEFVFGKDVQHRAGEFLKKYNAKKVLIHYGVGHVVKSGLLEQVENSLKEHNIEYINLGGAIPNPIDTLVYEGIELCKNENVDFILAVGGGSAIDSAKAIAAGVCYDGDFWDLFDHKAPVTKALPLATVLTIPAAGSEVSNATVITKTGEQPLKRGLVVDPIKPVFSLLNPELNYTLPPYQTSCGVADMMSHIFERYFTNVKGVTITDELSEAVLRTIIKYAKIAIEEPNNYEARANLTWAGMVAHDGSLGVGRIEDWGTHMLEHELSALYDVAHGAGLAVMFPAWMNYVYKQDVDRFARIAVKVWGIECNGNKEETALKGIESLKEFWKEIGLPTSFKELGAKKEDIPKLLETLKINTGGNFSSFVKLNLDDAQKIYNLAAAN